MSRILFAVWLTMTVCATAGAQRQLVVVRRDDVLLRLSPGDEIVLKVKGRKKKTVSYVNNLLPTAVVLHRDTVPFNTIDKIYFKRFSRANLIGGMMLFGGTAMLAVDQLNNSVVQGNEPSFDRGFTTVTAGIAAAGLPLFLIRRNYCRIGGRNRLLTATSSSIFFKPDPKGFRSPYMEN